jgi:hypothetical protein
LTLVFDDSQYNRSTIAATDGVVHEVDDTPSQPPILAYDDSGRILANDGDVQTVAQTIIDRYKDALYRIDAIQLNGARQPARTQILTRQIGDTIRIRRRGEGGTMIEIITRILGRSITIDTNRDLRCTYQLGRGFPADGYWHLGVDGFTELATNTVLA